MASTPSLSPPNPVAFKSEYKYTKQKVSLAEAQERALAYLRDARGKHPKRAMPSSWVAGAIWPGHAMSPQGAGLAASRILHLLERAGKIRYSPRASSHGAGWVVA